MNKTTFLSLYFIFCFQLAISQIGKEVYSFSLKQATVAESLAELEKISGISISFSSNAFDNNRQDYNFSDKSIDEILKKLLDQSGNTFKYRNNRVVIFKSKATTTVISGFVEDAASLEPLIGAHIKSSNGELLAVTNEYGFFSLELPTENSTFNVSYIGYESKPFNINKNIDVSRYKLQRGTRLEEVLITSEKSQNEIERDFPINKAAKQQYKSHHLKRVIALGGEEDYVQLLRSSNGVQAYADALGGWHVRGGSADQNQILVDGASIYNPSHAFGLLSIFNTDATKDVKFYKSGVPAKYGGYLSSVFDLYANEGSLRKVKGNVGISSASAKAHIEVPIIKEKMGVSISARKSIVDPFVKKTTSNKKANNGEEGQNEYSFYDVNFKIHTLLPKYHKLYFNFYKGGDLLTDETSYEEENEAEEEEDTAYVYEEESQSEYDWGNMLFSVRWNHMLKNNFFGNLIFSYSFFNYNSFLYNEYSFEEDDGEDVSFDEEDILSNYNSSIRDFNIKWDGDFVLNNKHFIEFGFQNINRRYAPGAYSYTEDINTAILDSVNNELNNLFDGEYLYSSELSVYFQDAIQWKHIHLTAGVRLSSLFTQGKVYVSGEPRLALTTYLNRNWSVHFSFMKHTQYSHVVSSTGGGLPHDLWVPSTDNVKPQHAWQTSGKITYQNSKKVSFSIEGYYKRMYNLIRYALGADLSLNAQIDASFWEDDIIIGNGKSYGIETNIYKKWNSGGITGAYTLSWAFRQYDELNGGKYFPYRYDRRHDLKLGFFQEISKNISVTANWYLGSGFPITLAKQRFTLLPANLIEGSGELVSGINAYRIKPFHQLDIGIKMEWEQGDAGKHVINLGVNNLYNRRNVVYAYIEDNVIGSNNDTQRDVSLIGILPSISYRFFFGK